MYLGVLSMNPERHIQKISLQGSFAPKIWNRKLVKQAPHSEQAAGHGMHCRDILFAPHCSPRATEFPRSSTQGMHCRDILFAPHCSPRATEFPRSVNFLYDVQLRSYRASDLPNFWILAYFLYTKPLKPTFWWPAYSPGITSQNDSDFSVWYSKVQRGAFLQRSFFATSDGELWNRKLAQIFAYGKWLYPYRMQLHGASDLD